MKDKDFMQGFIDATTDLAEGWLDLELSDESIASHVSNADNYSDQYLNGYMDAIAAIRKRWADESFSDDDLRKLRLVK